MPYKRIKTKIFKKVNDRWVIKQVAKTIANAIKALRLLRALEHGFKPTKRK